VTSLRDAQELMWTLIAAPNGVADGLRQIDKKSDDLERVLRGDERLSAVQRLDIYANMYFFRLYEVLQNDYPVLRVCLGDEAFFRLCTDYLAACPSQHPSVRNVGERLAPFLATHALGLERPWLAELAALERARLEVFDGPDAEALTMDELRARPPEEFVTLALPLIPSRRLVTATHAVDDVWSAVEGGDEEAEGEHAAEAHEGEPADASADAAESQGSHANADAVDADASVQSRGADASSDAVEAGAEARVQRGGDDADACDHDGCGAHADAQRPPAEPPAPEPRTLLVWRHGAHVYHRPLTALAAAALARAEAGATFGQICDLVAERLPMDEAGPAAFQLLATWVSDGIIARR